ncbi:hypothetical protein ACQPZ2_00960 [Nocardia pseudovaccinii]|uniref:hypothetical protein n=1 Tax=Nocardia pseudovaccinii TaxID=189540 RepID=UPI003D8FEC34
MFERCHGPREVAYRYSALGFPVELTFNRASFVTTASLGAVVMPPELGRAARQWLGDTATVPIITHARAGREWVFVVGPNRGRGLGARSLAVLRQDGVRMLAIGSRVWLPMSDSPTGWHWASPPREGARSVPPRTFVLQAAQHVLNDRALSSARRC